MLPSESSADPKSRRSITKEPRPGNGRAEFIAVRQPAVLAQRAQLAQAQVVQLEPRRDYSHIHHLVIPGIPLNTRGKYSPPLPEMAADEGVDLLCPLHVNVVPGFDLPEEIAVRRALGR